MAGMQIRQYQRFEYGEREVYRVNLRTGLLMCAALELDPVTLIFGERPEALKGDWYLSFIMVTTPAKKD